MYEHTEKRSSTGKHILVVEDDEAIAEMLTMLLEMENYQVSWASTACAALCMLSPSVFAVGEPAHHLLTATQTTPPDLILLDLRLPDMDGADMFRQVSQITHTVPPVVVLSAKSEQESESAARAIGAVSVVLKPFSIETLLASIDQALSQCGSDPDAEADHRRLQSAPST
jgi:DNA-binding response OmpR family regulator